MAAPSSRTSEEEGYPSLINVHIRSGQPIGAAGWVNFSEPPLFAAIFAGFAACPTGGRRPSVGP